MYVCVCSIAGVNKWVAPPQPKVMSACREPCKATTLLIQDAHDEEEDCDEVTIIAMIMKSTYFSSNSLISKSSSGATQSKVTGSGIATMSLMMMFIRTKGSPQTHLLEKVHVEFHATSSISFFQELLSWIFFRFLGFGQLDFLFSLKESNFGGIQ